MVALGFHFERVHNHNAICFLRLSIVHFYIPMTFFFINIYFQLDLKVKKKGRQDITLL